MEKTIVSTGKTIDLAIEAALNQLGLDRDSVSVMVLQQAKSGFLGFGAQPAKVQLTYEVPDPVIEKTPAQPKSALGSASRSKPKATAIPGVTPEPVKPEAPKPEAPKPEAPKAPSSTSPRPPVPRKSPKRPRRPENRSPKRKRSPRSTLPPRLAPPRKRLSSSSRVFWSTWVLRRFPTVKRWRPTPTRWTLWATIWAI